MSLWELILLTCSDFAKKDAHHEFISPGKEIEVRALGKAMKKSKIEETTEEKQVRKNNAFLAAFIAACSSDFPLPETVISLIFSSIWTKNILS